MLSVLTSSIVNAPAETTNYMIAGYLVIFSVMALYLFSISWRRRKLERDYAVLAELERDRK